MIEIYYLEKDTIKTSKLSSIKKIRGKPLWIDATGLTKEEADVLQETFNLHPLTAEDLLSKNARIKIEEFNEYMLSVFYTIKEGKEDIGLQELDFVLGKDYLISSHYKELNTFEILKEDPKKLASILSKGTDHLMHRLLDKEIDNYFPVLEKMGDEIEAIEDEIITNPKPKDLARILELKRSLINIKKTAFQQREKMSFLAKNEYQFISKKALPYFRDVYDHAIRVSDSIDNYREAISETFDAYMSAINNNMNEVMKVLSIIATIAMPLTVISGIYGTNFLNLPGSTYQYGFWVMIGFMLLMCFSMIYFFRKRGWF